MREMHIFQFVILFHDANEQKNEKESGSWCNAKDWIVTGYHESDAVPFAVWHFQFHFNDSNFMWSVDFVSAFSFFAILFFIIDQSIQWRNWLV